MENPDELRRLGSMATPVVNVDAEIIAGFDEARLTAALGL